MILASLHACIAFPGFGHDGLLDREFTAQMQELCESDLGEFGLAIFDHLSMNFLISESPFNLEDSRIRLHRAKWSTE
jgi:hypothetical protein